MSFRIDDILKRGPSPPRCVQYESCQPLGTCSYKPLNLDSENSILQQTLLRAHPYVRSNSDPYGTQSKYYDGVYNSVKMLYPYSSYPDPYIDKAASYASFYARTRPWPAGYPPISPFSQALSVLHYPYSQYSKRKGGQVRFTASQTDALEKRFLSHKYLSPEDRKILANSLKLTDRQVKTWFQNRRAKWRRCNSISSNNGPSDHQEDDSDSEDFVESSEQKPTSSTVNSKT